MLQFFPIECVANVVGPNNSFTADEWNYVTIVQAKGNVTLKLSGGESAGPFTQALGITSGEKVKRGVIQAISDQTETIILAFSGDGSRVTGFASGGQGANITNPMNVQGEYPAGTIIQPNPVVIGLQSGGTVIAASSPDGKGESVKQYFDIGANDINGTGSLGFGFQASAMALVAVEVTTKDTGGAVNVSIEGQVNGLPIQPQIRDQNRAQVISGAAKWTGAIAGTVTNVGYRVVFLIPADCLSVLVVHISGGNGDGIVHTTIGASPVGSI